jgi:DNA-binding SARP family transcriptional activator
MDVRHKGAGVVATKVAAIIPAETLHFSVLGPLTVTGRQGPLVIAGARRRAVLIRLVMARGRPVPLGLLAEDVWDGEPPPGAASTLRSHLSLLRRSLGPDRLFTRNGAAVLGVHPGEYDVASFESGYAQARQARADGDLDTSVEHLDRALGLWRGPAFADVDGLTWALLEVARLENERLGATTALVETLLERGDHALAVNEAESAVHEHPFREHLWALLIFGLYRSGRQADALRAYQRLRTVLADELGIDPSPTLHRLEQAILDHDPSIEWRGFGVDPTEAPASAPRARSRAELAASDLTWLPQVGSPAFIGREPEFERAMRARSATAEGALALLIITGEPGIGKTRLAAEVARACSDLGDLVLYGRCDEAPLSSFQGFRQALSRVVSTPVGRAALADIGPSAGPLCQVIPEAGGLADPEPDHTVSGAEAERFQSFEAVVALVGSLARSCPVVLVLEDLQWADAPTVSLLEHLARSEVDVPVLVIATCRDTEVGGTGWLSEGLVGLWRSTDVTRLDLAGLSSSTSFALFRDAVGSDGAPEEESLGSSGPELRGAELRGAELRDYTGGNPFFLQEVASDVLARGSPLDEILPAVTASGSSVPERLRDLVHWRLTRLSDPCTQVLSVASLMGSHFEVGTVLAATDFDETTVLSLVDEALAAGVISEIVDQPDCYEFVHDVVRQTLDVDLGSARRIRTHLRIARVLEERYGTDATRAPEIALHYCGGIAAGSAERACFYSRAAGIAALSEVAYESAAALFLQALEISTDHFPEDHAGRMDLLLLLADALVKAGRLLEADQRFEQAFEEGRRSGRHDVVAAAALGFGGVLPAGAEPSDTGRRLLRTALGDLDHDDLKNRALALGRLAHWEHFSLSRPERRELADEAVAIARGLKDPLTLAATIEYRYWALCGPDEVDRQIRAGQAIRQIGEELEAPELVLRGMKCELHAQFEAGAFVKANQLAHEMRQLADQVRQPEYLRLGFMWDSLTAGIQGHFDEAERSAAEAFDIFRRSGHSQAGAIAVGLSMTWLWLQGRIAEMEPMLEEHRTGRSSLGEQALLAWIAVEAGRHETAAAMLAGLSPESVATADRNFHWWYTVAGLSHAVLQLDDARWAGALYDLITPFASHNCRVGQATFLGSASYYLGSLATVAGRPDRAVPHLQDALVRHREMNAGPFIGLTEQALARATKDLQSRR